MTLDLQENVPLAPLTTLGVGGPARWLARVPDVAALRDALALARRERVPVFVLGDGSNVVVADAGFPGLVVQLGDADVRIEAEDGNRVTVRAGAGGSWDEVVRWAVERDLAGIECLSGIPGRVGAAPIQNIGAYGQEVGGVVVAVTAFDPESDQVREFDAEACRFGYRASRFKGASGDPSIVLGVALRLVRGGPPAVRYPELVRRVDELAGGVSPTLPLVRETVLAIRRSKSMVAAADDPNARSAGSFFVNPIVSIAQADAVARRVRDRGGDAERMPRHPAGSGQVKLSAAWLIEHAGFRRGTARGRVGLSERHVLALVNRGGASAAEILALAAEIRAGVADAVGVNLAPEPVLVGFPPSSRPDLGF